MNDQIVDRGSREQDFHAATNALDWRYAEQLALAALRDGDRMSAAERDAWRERRDAARQGLARRG